MPSPEDIRTARSADPFVQTVRGPIRPESLGPTLMHEHLCSDWPFGLGLVDQPAESTAIIERILTCLERASEAGVRGFVDVGTELYGPRPLLLLAVALQTPVHLVKSTGCFTADMLPPPAWVYPPAGPQEIAERFIKAAIEGSEESGVKPGIIKVGTSGRAISEIEENVLRGAAIAQRATGLAITTHTQFTRFAAEQIDILEDAGADLDRVVIGHIGWGSTADDFDLHERLVRRGVTLGLDCVGTPARTVEEYVRIATDLIDAGYSSQIVLSHDGVAFSRGLAELFGPEWLSGKFDVVHTQLLPLLAEAGVDDATLSQITSGNPAKILTIDPRRYPGALETLLKPVLADPFGVFEYPQIAASPPRYESDPDSPRAAVV
jgi:phosphotriesterase-related protein